MLVEGRFILNPRSEKRQVIRNRIVSEGGLLFLRSLFRGEDVLPVSFYLGLTNSPYNSDTVLADIEPGEPVGNGYARQELTRDVDHWTVSEVNGLLRAQSEIVTFTASADWNHTWNRMFLTDVLQENPGSLFALSGPTDGSQVTHTGDNPEVQYEYWLRQ